MNAYKLNGMAGSYYRQAVCRGLKIPHTDIYKTVKEIHSNGTVVVKDGRKFQLKLIEIQTFK
jgi:hypothetical protein